MKKLFIGFAFGVLFVTSIVGGAAADRLYSFTFLDRFIPWGGVGQKAVVEQRVLTEESVVINVAEAVSPSVVTVSVTQQRQALEPFFMDPFGMFRFRAPSRPQAVKQDIGSGFVIDGGLVVTNKHVVENGGTKLRVITKDDKEHDVINIYRDPTNDIAILKVDALDAPAAALGDSDGLKVGQFAIAIGTALGQFRHTVTTGVISGLGRGIEAGDPFGGFAESLDNVIQTDAAINPGNSGGPLLNSAGQVIGVNVAVAQSGQNIGFALPINVVKKVLDSFHKTGSFERSYLGVRYQMIPKETALMNDVPAGAYVAEVVEESPADRAGIKQGDIIVKLDAKKVEDIDGGLAVLINSHKVGDKIDIELFRDGETINVSATLSSQ